MYIEVVNLGYLDFVNCKDYKNIKAKEFIIRISKCLLKKLEVDGSLILKIYCPIFFELQNAKSTDMKYIFKYTKVDLKTTRSLCIY